MYPLGKIYMSGIMVFNFLRKVIAKNNDKGDCFKLTALLFQKKLLSGIL